MPSGNFCAKKALGAVFFSILAPPVFMGQETLGKRILRFALEKRENVVFSSFQVRAAASLLAQGFGKEGGKRFLRLLSIPPMDRMGLGGTIIPVVRKLKEEANRGGCNFTFSTVFERRRGIELTPRFKRILEEWGAGTGVLSPKEVGGNPGMAFTLKGEMEFIGKWASPFKEKNTGEGPFFVPVESGGGRVYLALFMAKEGHFPYMLGPGYQVLSMDFSGGDFSMIFILPFKGVDPGNVLKKIQPERIVRDISGKRPSLVLARVPKFCWRTSSFLSKWMKEIFPGGRDILPGTIRVTKKSISRVLKISDSPDFLPWLVRLDQAAKVAWDERGASAKAKTILTGLQSGRAAPTLFLADRPFFFFLVEKGNRMILFSGLVYRVGRAGEGNGNSKAKRPMQTKPDREVWETRMIRRISEGKGLESGGWAELGGLVYTVERVWRLYRLGDSALRIVLLGWIAAHYMGEKISGFYGIFRAASEDPDEGVRKKALEILEGLKAQEALRKIHKRGRKDRIP